MMWAAGAVAAMSSITFPAVSALLSRSADPDKQGAPLRPRPRPRSPLSSQLYSSLSLLFLSDYSLH